MTATVGDIAVRVGADITDLRRGMADGSNSVKKFSSDTSKHLRDTVTNLTKVGAAAAATGAAMLAGLYVKGAQAIDTQAKLAQALGGTITGLRAVEMAAGDAGVANSALAGEVTKLNARLGEAEKGTGAAHDALSKLGLSAQYLSSLDVDDRLAAIADRVKELGLSSSQTQAVMRDLGVRNENLANLMRQGGDSIRAQAEEVQNLGLALSMVDAAQVEAANDSLGIFQDVLTGIQDRVAVAGAPYVTALAEEFRQAALESGGFKNEIESLINASLQGFGKLGDVVQGLRVVFKGLEVTAYGFGTASVTVFEEAQSAIQKLLGESLSGINRTSAVIAKLPGVVGMVGKEMQALTSVDFAGTTAGAAEEMRARLGELRGELGAMVAQPMPSDKIEKFLARVAESSKAAAADVVSARASMMTIPENEMGGADVAGMQGRLDALRESFATEYELLSEKYGLEQELLSQSLEAKLLTQNEYNQLMAESEAAYQSSITELEQKGADARKAVAQAEARAKMQVIGGALSDLSTLMNSESRKMFEIGKAAAIGNTVMSTVQSAQSAYAAMAGIPIVGPALGIAAATAAGLAGMQRVQAIRSQSFGGGGSAAAATGSNTAAVNAASTPVGQGSGNQGGGTIRIEGVDPSSIYSGGQVAGLVGAIEQFWSDGGGNGRIIMGGR